MLKYRFCSITTLTAQERKCIYDKMSYPCGYMRQWLNYRSKGVRLCLIYEGEQIVNWMALWSEYNRKCIGGWTLSGYRRKGLAKMATRRLLNKHGIKKRTKICTYSQRTFKLMGQLEMNPISTRII